MNEPDELQDQRCALCGEKFDPAEMIEVEDGVFVCEACAVREYDYDPNKTVPEVFLEA